MKKKLLVLLSILVLSSTINIVSARTTVSSDLAQAIRLYKSGNYTECYTKLNEIVKKDSTNGLAYYYLGMTSAQVGKRAEALENYEKAISLTTPSSSVNAYAEKGKRCIESPETCNQPSITSSLDEFIRRSHNTSVSDEVKSNIEKLQIDSIKREINRSDDEPISPQRFREFKDFSTMNNDVPTNDEIVAAIKVLKNAGLDGFYNNDLSFLTGNNQQAQLLNAFGSSLSPQVIQAMLTNNMSLGF